MFCNPMNNLVKMPEVGSSPVLENCSFAGRLNIILDEDFGVSIGCKVVGVIELQNMSGEYNSQNMSQDTDFWSKRRN